MAYNTKEVLKDVDGNPISQYYDPITDSYKPVEGSNGGNKVIVENNDLSLIPILDKLSQLTGTVIDEESRKSNEITREQSEDTRQSQESTRQSQESIRENNEDDRKLVESQRVTSEGERVSAESIRVSNEDTRQSQESTRQSQESSRESNEGVRESQESVRESNEDLRITLYDDLLSKVATGFFKGEKGDTGNGLEYTWNGTQLGVRVEGTTEYVYVDLKGEKGETGEIENLTGGMITDALGYIPLSEDSLPSNLETTTGSQAKASQAEQNAKDYTDSELANFEGMVEHGNDYHTENYATESDLVAHKADYASFKNNIEAVKYEGDKLFLKVNGEWIEFKSKDGYPVGNVIAFSAKGDDKQVTLTWQDPADTTIDDSLGNPVSIAKWKGTKILRKIGSYPANENDGVLVVDNGIKNQYSENGFINTGLQNDVEYFYMAFPYTEEDVYTVDESNRISAIPTEIKIYGIEIDENNSNPETSVVYTDDAVGFIPASGNNGAFNWGSWESIIKDEFEIRPCVLNNLAKTVNYYLDYDDYTKKATGGASVLTGADGDVMTEFGTDIYTKWTIVGDRHHIQFSIKPFEGATKNAFETENGYNQFAYYPLLLTQKLLLLLFKNRDSQTALGRGYVDGNSGYATTGNTNTKGFMFGETTGKQQMKFLGIEDYWGNKYQWIDGLVTDANYNLLIGDKNFNDDGAGYTKFDSGVSTNIGGYVDSIQGGDDKGFIIKSSGGSENTYYCDYGNLYSSPGLAHFGGYRSNGSNAGAFFLRLNYSASRAGASIGARLFCKNNGKLYIGAYLGTTQGGKLRSVSGTTPSDNKTIGVFRNEARANNV